MSSSIVDQITLDCLLNKEIMGHHVMKQRERQQKKEEMQFYGKRIRQLFKELINATSFEEFTPDITYAFHNFVNTAIHSFKVIDNNDLLQKDYDDLSIVDYVEEDKESSIKNNNTLAADQILMRKVVKMDLPTLDKYVKKSTQKRVPKNEVVLPKLRVADLTDPKLKNKGIKKNITTLYEEDQVEETDENQEENDTPEEDEYDPEEEDWD